MTEERQTREAGPSATSCDHPTPSTSSEASDTPASFFDFVVVSFPDAESEKLGQRELDQYGSRRAGCKNETTARASCSGCLYYAVTDPFQGECRVGSGGGTFHALNRLIEHVREDRGRAGQDDLVRKNILIVHAGGESSRCPTQMVMGKAMTSLPCRNSERVQTPLSLLLRELEKLLQHYDSRGILVVAASDTLLSLGNFDLSSSRGLPVEWTAWQKSSSSHDILGVAVPASYDIASRHGVYRTTKDTNTQSTTSSIKACYQVLQKPSVELLQELDSDSEIAWIDTGILIFQSPSLVESIYRLASTRGSSIYERCTQSGLEFLYRKESAANPDLPLQEFLKESVRKVDLYTHILHAFQTLDRVNRTYEDYIETFSGEDLNILKELFESMSKFSLGVLQVPCGRFLHLGTTLEMVDFILQTRSDSIMTEFATFCGLTHRYHSFHEIMKSGNEEGCLNEKAVLIESVLKGEGTVKDCIVEHSFIKTSNGHLHIGSNALISGIRGYQNWKFFCPDNIVVQQIGLKNRQFVYMVFGIHDDIKQESSIYGRNIMDFCKFMNISSEDVWDTSECECRSLWNAKLHPVGQLSFNEFFAWLPRFVSQDDSWQEASFSTSEEVDASVCRWVDAKRLSLKEIRDLGDAIAEYTHRENLKKTVYEQMDTAIRKIVSGIFRRENFAVNLSFFHDRILCEPYSSVLGDLIVGFRDCLLDAYKLEKFDVCARILSVIYSFHRIHAPQVEVESNTDQRELDLDFRDNLTILEKAVEACQSRESHESSRILRILEACYKRMIRRCVCGDVYSPSIHLPAPTSEPVFGEWIHSSSPARIDLAGGWSDTPPICFEFGGAVVGLAITVDGKRPLGARCRLNHEGSGIKLISEHLDPADHQTLVRKVCNVSSSDDLLDYNNPHSDCCLLKSALICLGICNGSKKSNESLQSQLNSLVSSSDDVGLELISTSSLPMGSGLGTSSILAGCVVAVLCRCSGREATENQVIQMAFEVEQHMTTGGGFQDQVNGLVKGYKMSFCSPLIFPPTIEIHPINLPTGMELENRMSLIFTGKTRLARNVLDNVISNWTARTREIVHTVSNLVETSHLTREALVDGNFERLSDCVNRYWEQKKTMAGGDISGVEPKPVGLLINILRRDNLAAAACLCGAGGGGFLFVLRPVGVGHFELEEQLIKIGEEHHDIRSFSLHSVSVDYNGLQIVQ